MIDWIREHDGLMWTIAVISAILFVGSLVLTPVVVARIPVDYFAHRTQPPAAGRPGRPAMRLMLTVGRNIVGTAFIVAGVAMLLLPGQGILTIVIGFLVLDFPGKYRLERRLIRQRHVLRSINWLRRRLGREPLRVGDAPKPRS